MNRVAAALLLAALPLTASAGRIVNVQPAVNRGSEDGLSGELSGLFNRTTGNTEVTQLAASATGLYLTGPHRFYLSARASYGLKEGDAFINQTFEHLRYRHQLLDWLGAESFVQHEYDEFRRLQLRALFGVGPRVELPMPDGFEVAVGSAWMLEYRHFTEGDEADSGAEELNQRWSNYVFAAAQLDQGIQLTHTTYAQPRFDEFADWRLLTETALVLDVRRWLAVKIAYQIAYDSRPPDDVKRQDTSLATSLVFRL